MTDGPPRDAAPGVTGAELLLGVRRPQLLPLGGGGGQGHFLWEQWLPALPPEGPLKLCVAWPGHGIPETVTELDSAPIRAAAARATPLWAST